MNAADAIKKVSLTKYRKCLNYLVTLEESINFCYLIVLLKTLQMKIKIVLLALIFVTFLQSCKETTLEKNSDGKENIDISTTQLPTISAPSVNEALVEKLKPYLSETYLTDADRRAIREKDRKFQFYEIDLNNDGKKEVFVNFPTRYFCGSGGCTLLLLDSELNMISKCTVTQTPLYAVDEMKNGYKKIYTKSGSEWKKLVFDGEKYPSNPTLLKESTKEPGKSAEVIFADDANFTKFAF